MPGKSNPKLRFLVGYAGFFAALWLLWDTPIVYPLRIFVVLLHEVSHAAAAVATGGSIVSIELNMMEGGATRTLGGSALLTLSAGYLGSLGWGALMFSAAQTKWLRTDWVNAAIGAFVIALTAVFVQGAFGIVFGISFGLAMVVAARRMGSELNRGLLLALGLTSALYAILDIKSDILDRPELRSDARMLAEITGIPTVAWGIVWIGTALAVSFWLLRRAYRDA